jgi:uncharacterized membrane-anchored protein
MKQFVFKPGYKYSEFRKGDDVSGSGLTELMVSGTSAIDVKGGVAKGVWGVILPVLIGIGFLLRKVFRDKTIGSYPGDK